MKRPLDCTDGTRDRQIMNPLERYAPSMVLFVVLGVVLILASHVTAGTAVVLAAVMGDWLDNYGLR